MTPRRELMRFIALLTALLLVSAPAAAQKWREYGYLENSFAIQFPAEPKISEGSYATAVVTVNATIYALEQADARYSVTVADFSKTRLSEAAVLDLAIAELKKDGDVTVDIPHRVNRQLGRQLSIAGHDGSRSSIALFYYQHRLYEVKGTSEDAGSSDGARFQQSLRFTNDARPRDQELTRLRLTHPEIPDFARDR
jgi:hypothetical protein